LTQRHSDSNEHQDFLVVQLDRNFAAAAAVALALIQIVLHTWYRTIFNKKAEVRAFLLIFLVVLIPYLSFGVSLDSLIQAIASAVLFDSTQTQSIQHHEQQRRRPRQTTV
jgi:hypothetical protein